VVIENVKVRSTRQGDGQDFTEAVCDEVFNCGSCTSASNFPFLPCSHCTIYLFIYPYEEWFEECLLLNEPLSRTGLHGPDVLYPRKT
jgi:hypothetical protein